VNHIFGKAGSATAVSIFLLTSFIPPDGAGETFFPAGFDCAKAANKIENAICRTKELADADVRMARLYRGLLSTLPADQKETLKRRQMTWLKERDTDCDRATDINSCLKDQYARQIDALKNWPQSARKPSSQKESLLERLLSSNKSIRESASGSMSQLDVAAREALVKELIKALAAGNYDVHRRAVDALVKIGAPGVPALVEAYNAETTNDHTLRLAVINTLSEIGPATKDVIPTVLKGLKDTYWIVRLASADALGKFQLADKDVTTALAAATADADTSVRDRACQALGNIGPGAKDAVPAIVVVLNDKGPDKVQDAGYNLMHGSAASALGAIGAYSEDAVSALIKTLSDDQNFVRFNASEALAKIGPSALPALIAAMKDNDIYSRIEVVRAISAMKPVSPDAEPALVAALSDSNSQVCEYAVSALLGIGTESAKSAILKYEQNLQNRREEQAAAKEKELVRLYKKNEIVASIPPDSNNKYSSDLEYVFSIATYNQNELYVTLHKGKDRPDLLRIWRKTDDRYAIAKEMTAGENDGAYFDQVSAFSYNITRDQREQFIHVPLIFSGTGHYREDTIYCILPDLSLQEIVIEPAPDWFADKLKPGEGVWKGEILSLSSDKLEFEFYIWNEGDANCCPTAGRVKGTYKIVGDRHYDTNKKSEVANFRMIVGTYKRLRER
jgi:HEAT repeat protein/uncharacterized protein YecT (DUF1311 family)